MKLVLKKRFKKHLQKFSLKIQKKSQERLMILIENPNAKSLRRHALKGKYSDYESIDVTGDVRIIIQPQTGEIIDIYDIGTHAELY